MKYAMLQIKKDTHELLKEYCEEHGFKMGSLVENLIKKHIGISKPQSGVLLSDKIKSKAY
jgi:inactivated superfamily I helicase